MRRPEPAYFPLKPIGRRSANHNRPLDRICRFAYEASSLRRHGDGGHEARRGLRTILRRWSHRRIDIAWIHRGEFAYRRAFLRGPPFTSLVRDLGLCPSRLVYSRDVLVLLQNLLDQGLGKRAVAQQLGISPRTVHHWIATGQVSRVDEAPTARTTVPRPQRLDPCKALIPERRSTCPAMLSAERLVAESATALGQALRAARRAGLFATAVRGVRAATDGATSARWSPSGDRTC